jgi:hypothetical protein
MILLFNNQPVTLSSKVSILLNNVQLISGSNKENRFNILNKANNSWLADELTVESLFPQWLIKEYKNNPSNVTIITIVKNYMRWLLSQDYGYGAQLNWENLRIPLYANSVFLEAYADFYFPNADFSQQPLSNVLTNIRAFSVMAGKDYFDIKGTPAAIKYVICSLLGFQWNDVIVSQSMSSTILISIASAQSSSLNQYKPFLMNYVIPAGIVVNYSTF